LRVLSIGALFTSLAAYFANLLSVAAQTKKILGNLIFVAILNLALDIVLVPLFGLVGAAVATSFSGLILFIINLVQVKRSYLEYPVDRKSCIILSIASLILCGSFFLGSSESLITLFLVNTSIILAYILTITCLRFFDAQDIDLFKKILMKLTSLFR